MKIDESILALVLKATLKQNLVCIEHDHPHKTFVQYRVREDNGDTRSNAIGLHELGYLYKKYLAINKYTVISKTFVMSTGVIANDVAVLDVKDAWSISEKEEYELVISLTQQIFLGKNKGVE